MAPSQDSHEAIPTYEESVQQGATGTSSLEIKDRPSQEPPQSLVDRLSSVRRQRINALINTQINPLLEQQADSGLQKSIFILVPSNSTTLQAQDNSSDIIQHSVDAVRSNKNEEVIGFREGEYVKLVRLHGDEYNLEFWRQTAVISELSSALQTSLRKPGHSIALTPNAPTALSPTGTKKSHFDWRKKDKEVPLNSRKVYASDWRFEKEEALENGEVRIKIGLQDVSLRMQSEMGLYDTRTGKAVVVSCEM